MKLPVIGAIAALFVVSSAAGNAVPVAEKPASALTSSTINAQLPALTLDDLYSSPSLFGTQPSAPAWAPDSRHFAFTWNDRGEPRRQLWLASADGSGLRQLTTSTASVAGLLWSADAETLYSLRGGELWASSLSGDDITLGELGPGVADLSLAPDGSAIAYRKSGDLWLFDLQSRSTRRLTSVGIPPLSTPPVGLPVGRYQRAEREIGPGIWGGPSYAWSPDSKSIVVHHVDRQGMRKVPFPDYLGTETAANEVRRGYPGDPNETRRVGLLDVQSGELSLLDLPSPSAIQIIGFSWSQDGVLLLDLASDTAEDRWIYRLDPGAVKPRLIWQSHRESRIYTSFAARWLPGAEQVVFLSDLGDRYGLYAVDAQGGDSDPKLLSDSRFDVLSPPTVMPATGTSARDSSIYYAANSPAPREQQIYRINVSETGVGEPESLTRMPGRHSGYPSPDGLHLAVLHSSDQSPVELYVLSTDTDNKDRNPTRVTYSPPPEFGQRTWAKARYVSFPSAIDDYTLHARILEPQELKPGHQYPVLFGPMYSNTVRNRQSGIYDRVQQLMVQKGYIVVQVDMRGSTGYGREFREEFLTDFAGDDIEDIVSAVEYLKTLPYIDTDRMGIWGSSYGGTLSVYTLLKKPGLFRAGVAAAAAVDPHFFGTDDVAIVRRPDTHPEVFLNTARRYADNLQDHLLIIHGMQDQVVPFKTTAELADVLIRSGKDFDFAFAPGATHGWSREQHYSRYLFGKLLQHFDRYLMPDGPKTRETAGKVSGGKAPVTDKAASENAEPSVAVIAALEAAARGEAYRDDLHPDTELSGKTPMPAAQQAFDVRHYALKIRVMPATRSISGSVEVDFEAMEPLREIQLDLDPKLTISGVYQDGLALPVTRDAGSFTVTLPEPLAQGARSSVTVAYQGKPHVALAPPWFGGFVWSEVDGTPWFATAVQGNGCDLWWPCKDNFADKPDEGVSLAISAPRGVKVASVGTLEGVDSGDDGFDTWRWASRHPYAGYAIAINGGPYELIEQNYSGINGSSYPIQFWALAKNAEKARKLVASDVVPDLEFFERMLGPYPWGDEKAGFVETPHLGMEHQTINGYGEQYKRGRYGYDGLLHHELAHEWFGNVMTHARPEDAWLHEGYGAYMQAVYAEETVGMMGYFDVMYRAYTSNEHCLPVVSAAIGDVGEAFDNRDIYTKGTWMLHTLRRHMGEEAFWTGTQRMIYDTADPWALSYPIQFRYRSTADFVRIMSEEAGEDLGWLIDTYLRETQMPELVTRREDTRLTLEWSVPGARDFPMPVEVSVNGAVTTLDLSGGEASIDFAAGARVIVDPNSNILRSLPIIGDCSEQTDTQINANIERFTRMAKEFGWQRD